MFSNPFHNLYKILNCVEADFIGIEIYLIMLKVSHVSNNFVIENNFKKQ